MAKKMTTTTPAASVSAVPPTCGIVMPISTCDGCNEQHWVEVKAIITAAVETAGYSANLVSDADDVGIIQKRIVQNLYENPIVVCDVSGKNANVMFEMGMRLAFDKPTIIVKDDKTSYSFDTGQIEHLEYPRDLRFARIVDFKELLVEKLKATIDRANKDKNYSPFLKSFGTFSVAKLHTKELSREDFIIEELNEVKNAVLSLQRRASITTIQSDAALRARKMKGTRNSIDREYLYSPFQEFVIKRWNNKTPDESGMSYEQFASRVIDESLQNGLFVDLIMLNTEEAMRQAVLAINIADL